METTVLSRIEPKDLSVIADAIKAEFDARTDRRKNLVKHWDEIDRQLRMEPELSHKMGIGPGGNAIKDPRKAWMPEVELPLQAGALETLLSDVRRLRYPTNQDWFSARVALTPTYLNAFEKAGAPFVGEKGRFDGAIAQDDADKLVQGYLSSFHSVYDFRGHMDLIDAQALSYGGGVGRIRRVKGRHLGMNAKRQAKEKTTPVVVPRNIRNVLFDDSQHALMHEGHALGPSTLQDRKMKLVDLNAWASDDETFYKDQVRQLAGDKDKNVTLVELEGDFAYDRGAETVILRDVELLLAFDSKAHVLVRAKEGERFSTYLAHQYHLEGPNYAYASAPLLKGMPIAKAAAQAMNRLVASGQLKIEPPISYSPDDPYFSSDGGPSVHPGALWKTADGVDVHDEVGGDPQIMQAVFAMLVQLYSDVVGVTPARLGAETKSHTTAFAKEVEVNRGSVRTVDYVRATLEGQMTRLLNIEYRMGLDNMRGPEIFFIEAWDDFVELKKGHLPEVVRFKAIGSDAPAEEQERVAERVQTAQGALQIDASAIQLGQEPTITNVKPFIDQLLREGGWNNLEELYGDLEGAGVAPDQLPGLISTEPRLVS